MDLRMREAEDGCRPGLLPQGLQDTLAPDAAREAAASEALIAHFARWGYERVHPPLLEFEEGLAAVADGGRLPDMFRLLDPESRRVMVLRSDITLQMARLAATRLKAAPRPLRLAYAGPVMKVTGDTLQPSRQFRQVGIELIGTDSPRADREVARAALSGLQALGMTGLVIDVVCPPLLEALLRHWEIEAEHRAEVLRRVDVKDIAGASRELAADQARLLADLMAATGPLASAGPLLERLALPAALEPERRALLTFAEALARELPDVTVTIDPLERRGFEYHRGIAFAIFATAAASELGRGGRYRIRRADGRFEPAVGFSAYMDRLLPLLPPAKETSGRIYACPDADPGRIASLRREGAVVIEALTDADANGLRQAARRLGCTRILDAGGLKPLAPARAKRAQTERD